MFYIVILGYTYELKTGVEKSVASLLNTQNRRIIKAPAVDEYKEQLLEQIQIINRENPHDKPIEAAWMNPGIPCLPNDAVLSFKEGGKVRMICSFTLYASE